MLGTSEIDKILNPDASESEILAALSNLGIESLKQDVLDTAVNRISLTADIHPDLALELYELGRFSIDCSGTGGSGIEHFNTSTSVAFVLSAADFKVAKFGSRAASGKSGSFDFLDCLGFPADLPLQRVADAISVCGLALIFAPSVYPHLRRLAPLRKKHGVPTVLNFIGPLLNPVHPGNRMMGVSSDFMRKCIATHLQSNPRINRAMLVTGGGKLDEICIDTASDVSFIDNAVLSEYQIHPEKLSLALFSKPSQKQVTACFDAKSNAESFMRIIKGEDSSSHAYKMIVLNSGAALHLLKAANSIDEGIALAAELIASRAVYEQFQTCRRFYGQLSS